MKSTMTSEKAEFCLFLLCARHTVSVQSTFAALEGVPKWLFMSCQEELRGNLI